MTVAELMEVLRTADPNAEVVLHTSSRGRGHDAYQAKFFHSYDGVPYDGNGVIDKKIDSQGCVFVISDWKI